MSNRDVSLSLTPIHSLRHRRVDLGVQAAHDARPARLPQHHRRGDGGCGLGVQAAHDARPGWLQHHRQDGRGSGLGVQAAHPELLLQHHRRGGCGGGLCALSVCSQCVLYWKRLEKTSNVEYI
eukprot:scaffold9067_cov60-Phaeocystis_antarctica.AAC.6